MSIKKWAKAVFMPAAREAYHKIKILNLRVILGLSLIFYKINIKNSDEQQI